MCILAPFRDKQIGTRPRGRCDMMRHSQIINYIYRTYRLTQQETKLSLG